MLFSHASGVVSCGTGVRSSHCVAGHPGVGFSGYTFAFLISAIAPATSPPTGNDRIPVSIVFEGELTTRYPAGTLPVYPGGRNTTLSPLPFAGPGTPRSAIQS